MCGIVGGVFFSGQVDKGKLEKAVTILEHRGPDEFDIHTVNNVGFGHARLSIIDLEGGKQPLHNAEGNLHLVANGEVYNYVEVGEKYPLLSESALSSSDSEAILQVYQEKGCAGFSELNGMFSFALYDERENVTILARDRQGIKPLFLCQTEEGVFFSSEIKALLPLLNTSPKINADALAQFLQCQFSTGRETIFKGIQRVLPGEYVVINNRQLNFHRYWSLKDVDNKKITLDEAFEEFEPLFDQVMKEHMRADVPFGLFLSGGIDSSILLAELSKLHDKQLNTYSIGYTGTVLENELDAASSLASQFGTNHHTFKVTKDELFSRIVYSIWAADDLMRDYASLPTLMLAQEAAKDLKVVFSGEGGDEAFAGYRRYEPHFAKTLYHNVLGKPLRVKGQWNQSVTKNVFGQTLADANFKQPFLELWGDCKKHWSIMQKRQYVDLNAALVDNLFVKTDRMMMANGLEGRVPLSDHRIVEFGFSLPDEIKYQSGRGKWFLRKWAEKYLPKDHLSRPKRGFYVPVNEWMTREFLNHLEAKLITNKAIRHWFNLEGIKYMFQAHVGGKNYSREIWGLMQFAIWHNLFVENPGVTPNKNENPLDWI